MTTDKFLTIVYPKGCPDDVEIRTLTQSLHLVTLYRGDTRDMPDILRYAEVKDANLTLPWPVIEVM